MPETNHRIAIVVAVIGVIGTLGTALIGNWDKMFPPPQPTPPIMVTPQPTRAESQSTAEPIPNIVGVWRDSNYPSNGSRITQDGNSFHLTSWGVLPNGIRFESSGSGTITGQRLTSKYTSRYQTGAESVGDCSGTVSPDGKRMDVNCKDSLVGVFPLTSVRQ